MADDTENQKSNHGWKTYLAAGMVFLQAVDAGAVNHDWQGALTYLSAAVALVGIRGALAKVIAAARGIAG
jgi:hypothetical protein